MNSRTHCIFRRGQDWLALPATSVREALPSPPFVSVPRTPETFAGLCHLRNEFIPVLNLGSDNDLVVGNHHDLIMLVVDDTDGCWAVLVDEVSSLAALEFSDAPEPDATSVPTAVIGWASHNNTVVQILDPTRLRELAEQTLGDFVPGNPKKTQP